MTERERQRERKREKLVEIKTKLPAHNAYLRTPPTLANTQ